MLESCSEGHRKKTQLCCPEHAFLWSASNKHDAWIMFRRLFMKMALEPKRPNYVLHASAVANRRGESCLIIGAADSGKTSTLVGLLTRGYRMATDDYTPLAFGTGSLIMLPVGVTVSQRTVELFPELGGLLRPTCFFKVKDDEQWTVNLGEVFTACEAYEELRPRVLIFLFPDFGNKSVRTECEPDWGLWWLPASRMKTRNGSVLPVRRQEEAFSLAHKLVQECRVFKVMNGCINETVSLIQEVFAF
jgi:hypothetical protein